MRRGLTLVVAGPDPVRAHSALAIAAAEAALGGRVRLFFDRAAVALLAAPPDPALAMAMELGVEVVACQTGLAEHGVDLAGPDCCAVQAGGLVSLLADLSDDRLLMA